MKNNIIDEILRQLFSSNNVERRVVSYYFISDMTEPVVHVNGKKMNVANGKMIDDVVKSRRDLFYDIFDEYDKIRVVIEMPGTKKDDIKAKAGLRNLDITIPGHDVCHIKLPCRVNPSVSIVSYLNGILEVSLIKDEGLVDLTVD